jgi:membrane protease YdiL (CAAX protease family)
LLIPALYISYSLAVDEFSWAGLLIALAFVTLPALVFLQSRARRLPTMFDLIATLYLLLSLELHLLPTLQLPQQGGQVHFFFLSLAPLLLLLLAARGWPGLGFTWFMNWRDLRTALLTAGGVLLLLSPLALAFNLVQPASSIPPTIAILTGAVQTYFLIALPQEILFRGLIQNGIERFTDAKLWRGAGSASEQHSASLYNPRVISLGFAAVIAGSTSLTNPIAPPEHVLLAVLAHLGYGWVYQHTGKVTVSAVTHMLVVWGWLLLFV